MSNEIPIGKLKKNIKPGLKYVRGENPGQGKNYEINMMAYMGLKLFLHSTTSKEKFEEFDLGFNLKNMGKFDDLVIVLNKESKKKIIAIQLKHKELKEKILTTKMLLQPKGNFSLLAYAESAKEMQTECDHLVLFSNIQYNKDIDLIMEKKPTDDISFILNTSNEENIYVLKNEIIEDYIQKLLEQHEQNTIELKKKHEEKLQKQYNEILPLLKENVDFETYYQKCGLLPIDTNKQKVDKTFLEKFFGKFLLYINQKSKNEIKQDLQELFANKFGASGSAYQIYIDLCADWYDNESIKNVIYSLPRLSKKTVGKLLVVSLLNPFVASVKPTVEDEWLWQTFQEVIHEFSVTFIDANNVEKWTTLKKDENYKSWQHDDSVVLKISDRTYSSQILQAITIIKEIEWKKNIVVVGNIDKNSFDNKFNSLKSLNQLNPDHQELFIYKIKESIDLVSAITNKSKEEILIELTPTNWFEIFQSESTLNIEEEMLPDFYIKRTLQVPLENILELFKNINSNVVFLICNNRTIIKNMLIEKDSLKMFTFMKISDNFQKNNRTKSIIMTTKDKYMEDLNEYRKKNEEENIHIFQIYVQAKEFYFEWIYCDNLKDLPKPEIKTEENIVTYPKAKLDHFLIKEDNIISTLFNRVNIVCAEPGMGKSSSMKSLHNQLTINKYHSTLISFKDNVNFFKNYDEKYTVADILRKLGIVDVGVVYDNVKTFYSFQNKIVLLLDGLDELSIEYVGNALNCIEKLLSVPIYQIWISTRKHLKTDLENRFGVHSIDISLFTEKNQKDYLRDRLKTKPNSEDIIYNIYNNKNLNFFRQNWELLGVPLLLYILTEVLINSKETQVEQYLNLSKLYDNFFTGKVRHHYEKLANKPVLLNDAYYIFEILGLKLCLDENDYFSLNITDYDKCLEKIEECKSLGIVTNINGDNVAIFEHYSFAEYFCALYFVENYEKILSLKDFILKPKYKTIRLFIDLKLAENSNLHLNIIYGNYRKITKTNKNLIRKCKDKAKRNLLQLAITYGHTYPENEPYNLFRPNIHFLKMITTLCKNIKLEEEDLLLKCSSIDYATKMNELGVMNSILAVNKNINFFNSCNINKDFMFKWCTKCKYTNLLSMLLTQESNTNIIDKNNSIPLYVAAENGDDNSVRILLDKGVNPNGVNEDNWTPLHIAVKKGHDECVKTLLEKGADINSVNKKNWTPFHMAAQNGHGNHLKTFLERGADINCLTHKNKTPLHLAASNGHNNCIKTLIENGAAINCIDHKNWTALHAAANNGHDKCVETLLENAAYVNCVNNKDQTPLYIAAQNGHEDCVRALLEKGAEIHCDNTNKLTPLHIAATNGYDNCIKMFLKNKANINCVTLKNTTPLHKAAKYGRNNCVETLIENGADIHCLNHINWTPLHFAASHGHDNCVKTLLKNGAKIDCVNNDNWTPLFAAAQNGHNDCVKTLLEKGANVNCANNNGSTPVYIAAQNGHDDCIKTLLKKGAEINWVTQKKWTPLLVAAQNGHNDCIKTLLKNEAEIHCLTKTKWTPLHIAVRNGHDNCVKTLIEKGADIHYLNESKSTPLHIAAQQGHTNCVKILLSKGANVNCKNKLNQTPLDLAQKYNHISCVNILQTYQNIKESTQ